MPCYAQVRGCCRRWTRHGMLPSPARRLTESSFSGHIDILEARCRQISTLDCSTADTRQSLLHVRTSTPCDLYCNLARHVVLRRVARRRVAVSTLRIKALLQYPSAIRATGRSMGHLYALIVVVHVVMLLVPVVERRRANISRLDRLNSHVGWSDLRSRVGCKARS
nr:hypothetical protein CFP56_75684 [Quercus suber]